MSIQKMQADAPARSTDAGDTSQSDVSPGGVVEVTSDCAGKDSEAAYPSARDKAQQPFEACHERLYSVVASLPEVIWSIDSSSGKPYYVGPAFAATYGGSEEAFYKNNIPWGDLVHPDDRTRAAFEWEKALHGWQFEGRHRIVTPAGQLRVMHSRWHPVQDPDGNTIRIDGISHDVTLNSEQEQKLQRLAYFDGVTGLANRDLYADRLNQYLMAAHSAHRVSAVVILDIVRFRNVNDTLGRKQGDALLCALARRLEQIAPERMGVARLHIDCFVLTLENMHDAELSRFMRDRVFVEANRPFNIDGDEFRIAVKAGIAVFPNDGVDADILLRNAEAALKRAKARNEPYLFYTPEINARAACDLRLETRLRRALENEQFVLYYQPKLDAASGQPAGLEALIRWNDPDEGLIAPASFIPALEENGLILEVGTWAIRRALADHHDWYKNGLQPPPIAVNVSPLQLRSEDFVEVVRGAMAEANAAPRALELEITESLIMQDIDSSVAKLAVLRNAGVNITIDDFGTGYSSLSYLATLPVHALKIDRSFVMKMMNDADNMAIVTSIISLAHALKLKVVAEGVETEEQARFLRLLQCDEMQGYLYSRPLPPVDVGRLLEIRRSGALGSPKW